MYRLAVPIAFLLAAVLFALPPAAHADTRVALVIGNGAYKNLPALKNPPNDARDLAEALRKLDFDVDLGADLTLIEMQRKVTAFAKRAQTADVALAFYAGHGVQAADPLGSAHAVNYLLPVDADIKEESDLGFLLTARDILARLQSAGSVRILILDACRDNPIPQRLARGGGRGASVPRGLGPEPKTSGTLIAYSTQPDTLADDGDKGNSPFIQALLEHIADPGVDIRLLFADVRREVIRRTHGAQTPETSDSLEGRFTFKNAAAVATAPEAPPPATSVAPPVAPATPPDEAAWGIVKDTREAEELRRFIARYPTSPWRHEAEERIKAIEQTHVATTKPAAPPPPAAPATPPDEIAWGIVKDTREAEELRRFIAQYPASARRHEAEERIRAIEQTHVATTKPDAPPPAPPPTVAPATPPDEVAWRIVKDAREAAEFRRFIAQYPASVRRREAEERIKALEQHVAVTVPVRPPEAVRPTAGPCGGVITASLASRATAPLSAAEECSLKPRDSFRECAGCPEMLVVPNGAFTMGSPETELGRVDSESPQHVVRIARPFAIGKVHVTVDQFAAFVSDTAYVPNLRCSIGSPQPGSWRSPGFAQDGGHPVVCIDWNDAKAYVDWLAKKTGRFYRLPTEAEWEYASRARTAPGMYPRLWSGPDETTICRFGNGMDQRARGILWQGLTLGVMPCNDGYLYTAQAGHYAPNAFGLHDMFGNARQWTADCWHANYIGAPADGSAWLSPGPCSHVVRGGAWNTIMRELRSASRYAGQTVDNTYSFRVARTLAVADGTQASDISHPAAPGGDVAAAGAARGWIGLQVQAVTPELVARRGLTVTRGVLVATAQPDSPAAHAGIESGDVITAINGRDIGDARDLARTISTVLPGDTVRLSVIRRGQEKTFNMTIGALPDRR